MERRLPSPGPLAWLVLGFVAAMVSLQAAVGADARWLAALGGAVVGEGALGGVPYASLPSAGWENAPVLGELLFHGFQAAAGDRGLLLLHLGAVAAGLAALACDLRLAGGADAPSSLVLLLAATASAGAVLVVRAQLFSLALFPLLVLLLRRETRRPSRGVWLLPPLLALWGNLHGAALLGLAVAAAYLLLERARRQPACALAVLLLSAGALLLTPALLGSVGYYQAVLGSEAAAGGEGMWQPLSLARPLDLALLVCAAPLVAAALVARPAPWEVAVMAGLAAMTAQAGRSGVWLALFAAAPAVRRLTGSRQWTLAPPPRLAWVLAAGLAAAIVAGVERGPATTVAGAALRAQAAAAAGASPILADADNAEALAADGRRVWIANPLEAFPREQQRLYLDWLAGRRPAGAVAPGIGVVLVRAGSPPERRLAADPAFRQAGRDGRAVLYVRRNGMAHGASADRLGSGTAWALSPSS